MIPQQHRRYVRRMPLRRNLNQAPTIANLTDVTSFIRDLRTIQTLNNEQLTQIFESLDTVSRLQVEGVCRQWRYVSACQAWLFTNQLECVPRDFSSGHRELLANRAINPRILFKLFAKRCARYVHELVVFNVWANVKFFHLLYKMPFIQYLSLENVDMLNASDFRSIARCLPEIVSLAIVGCRMHFNFSSGFEHLLRVCNKLQFLSCMKNEWFFRHHFNSFPSRLKMLQYDSYINEASILAVIERISDRCPDLAILRMPVHQELATSNIAGLFRLRNLTCFEMIRNSGFPVNSRPPINPILQIEMLKVLSLTFPLQDQDLASICKQLRELQHLMINCNVRLLEGAAQHLTTLRKLRSLAILSPCYMFGNTAQAFREFEKVAASCPLEYLLLDYKLPTKIACNIVKACPTLRTFIFKMREQQVSNRRVLWTDIFSITDLIDSLEEQKESRAKAQHMGIGQYPVLKLYAHPEINVGFFGWQRTDELEGRDERFQVGINHRMVYFLEKLDVSHVVKEHYEQTLDQFPKNLYI